MGGGGAALGGVATVVLVAQFLAAEQDEDRNGHCELAELRRDCPAGNKGAQEPPHHVHPQQLVDEMTDYEGKYQPEEPGGKTKEDCNNLTPR